MKNSVAIASTAVLFGLTALLAYLHAEYALFPWYEWLKTENAALVIWGITLRLVGGVQVVCFGSLLGQIVPLAGKRGMQPLGQQLRTIAQDIPSFKRFLYYPSVFWVNSSDFALRLVVAVGFASAWGTVLGVLDSRLTMLVSWVCLLSLDMPAGLGYPWDCYLLETTFLCLFFPPLHALPAAAAVPAALGLKGAAAAAALPQWSTLLAQSVAPSSLAMTAVPPVLAAFLWRWLAFRLMIGFGKLKFTGTTDKDDLYIKSFWVNMPMTTYAGWAGYRLPDDVHRFNLIVMFVVEVVVPFMYFLNGWSRVVAALGVFGLQFGIHATGNFGYFNLLTAVAAVPLFLHSSTVWAGSFGAQGAAAAVVTGAASIADTLACSGVQTIVRLAARATGGAVGTLGYTCSPLVGPWVRSTVVPLLDSLWGRFMALPSLSAAVGGVLAPVFSAVSGVLPAFVNTALAAVSYTLVGPSAEFEDAGLACSASAAQNGTCLAEGPFTPLDGNTWTGTPSIAALWFVAVLVLIPASIWHLPLNSWATNGFGYWPVMNRLEPRWFWAPLFDFLRWVGAWRLVHAYGVFPPHSAPPQRTVPVFEGSADGKTWRQWQYHHMASHAKSHPVFVAPHHPRLDHGIFYDAMGINGTNHMLFTGGHAPWMFAPSVPPCKRLAARLLEGAANPVYALFKGGAANPFPDPAAPPRFVRVSLYRMTPTTPSHAASTGEFWDVTHMAEHMPPLQRSQCDMVWSQWLSPPEKWAPTSVVWKERAAWTRRGVTWPEYQSAWDFIGLFRTAALAVAKKRHGSAAAARKAGVPPAAKVTALSEWDSRVDEKDDSTAEPPLTPSEMRAVFSWDDVAAVREELLSTYSADELRDMARIVGAMCAPLLGRLHALYGRAVPPVEQLAKEAEQWERWAEAHPEAAGLNGWSAEPQAAAETDGAADAGDGSVGAREVLKRGTRKVDVFATVLTSSIKQEEGELEVAEAAAGVFDAAGTHKDWRRCYAALRGVAHQPADGIVSAAYMSTPVKLGCYAHYLIMAGGRAAYERAVGGQAAIVGGHPLPLVWPPSKTTPPAPPVEVPEVYRTWAHSPVPLPQLFLDTASPAVNPGSWGGTYCVGFFLESILHYDSVAYIAEKWRLVDGVSRKTNQADPAGGVLPGFLEVVLQLRGVKSLRPWSELREERVAPTIIPVYDCEGPDGWWVQLSDGRKEAGRGFAGGDVQPVQ